MNELHVIFLVGGVVKVELNSWQNRFHYENRIKDMLVIWLSYYLTEDLTSQLDFLLGPSFLDE
jgi:hypothetical protein